MGSLRKYLSHICRNICAGRGRLAGYIRLGRLEDCAGLGRLMDYAGLGRLMQVVRLGRLMDCAGRMRLSGRIMMGMLLGVAGILSGCTEETKIDVASKIRPGMMPTMTTRNVSTLISDSGVTQYRIVAPLWEVFDEGARPHWRFPEGIYLRKYDRKFRVIATIAADSATYFKNEGIWRLDGRVEVTKVPKELFQSPQVFWDQNKGIVYSDSFIHIENATHMMEGVGFTAKQDFSEYRITRPLGIFPAEREKLSGSGGQPPMPSQNSAPRASGGTVPMHPAD